MQSGVLCFTWLSLFDKLDFFLAFSLTCVKRNLYTAGFLHKIHQCCFRVFCFSGIKTAGWLLINIQIWLPVKLWSQIVTIFTLIVINAKLCCLVCFLSMALALVQLEIRWFATVSRVLRTFGDISDLFSTDLNLKVESTVPWSWNFSIKYINLTLSLCFYISSSFTLP